MEVQWRAFSGARHPPFLATSGASHAALVQKSVDGFNVFWRETDMRASACATSLAGSVEVGLEADLLAGSVLGELEWMATVRPHFLEALDAVHTTLGPTLL